MQGEVVSIGTELLLGQIVDTNAAHISQLLASVGVSVYYRTTVGDNVERAAQILREALEHGRWTMVPDKAATEFWRLYWERASTIAPDLRMPEPKDRPATSSFIFFRPFGLAPGVSLLHKLPYGNVDLQFARMGDRLVEITQRYGGHLDSDMRVDQATRSGVVRITVPRIDMGAPFVTSKAAVEAGIRAATRLLALYKRVVP